MKQSVLKFVARLLAFPSNVNPLMPPKLETNEAKLISRERSYHCVFLPTGKLAGGKVKKIPWEFFREGRASLNKGLFFVKNFSPFKFIPFTLLKNGLFNFIMYSHPYNDSVH